MHHGEVMVDNQSIGTYIGPEPDKLWKVC